MDMASSPTTAAEFYSPQRLTRVVRKQVPQLVRHENLVSKICTLVSRIEHLPQKGSPGSYENRSRSSSMDMRLGPAGLPPALVSTTWGWSYGGNCSCSSSSHKLLMDMRLGPAGLPPALVSTTWG